MLYNALLNYSPMYYNYYNYTLECASGTILYIIDVVQTIFSHFICAMVAVVLVGLYGQRLKHAQIARSTIRKRSIKINKNYKIIYNYKS